MLLRTTTAKVCDIQPASSTLTRFHSSLSWGEHKINLQILNGLYFNLACTLHNYTLDTGVGTLSMVLGSVVYSETIALEQEEQRLHFVTATTYCQEKQVVKLCKMLLYGSHLKQFLQKSTNQGLSVQLLQRHMKINVVTTALH